MAAPYSIETPQLLQMCFNFQLYDLGNRLFNYPAADLMHKPQLGRVGFEHTLLTPSKTPITESDSAKSGAHDAPNASNFTKYPDLQLVVNSWPNLPEHIRQTIKMLVEMDRKQEKI
jgi:hypothetical protein